MTHRFDDVEIDEIGFRVTRAGVPVRLEPKAVELLLFLASNPGRLVTKAEIQEAVWKETFVTENALTRLVAQIRKGLDDDARDARYIETVPTKGYRFVAPLRPGGEPAAAVPPGALPPGPDAAPLAPATAWRRRGLRAAAVLLALLALALATRALIDWSTRPASATAGLRGASLPAVEQQVSSDATLNVFPCFSPDGASLAFATLRQGSMEIVLRALAPGAREVAVTSDGMQNVQPAFSPDGRLLAYHSVRRGGIWVVPALGGLPRQLTRFGSRPAWSPDGSRIAFQGQSWVGSISRLPAGEGSTIWQVASEGGEPRQLTSIQDVGPGGQGAPAWSPDGRLLSFVADSRVYSVRRDGSGLRQTSSGAVWVREVVWDGSGRSQLWMGSQAGNWLVWRVPVSPVTGEPTGEPEALASGGEEASAWAHPAVSPDGRSVAYVTLRIRYDILAQPVTPDGQPEGAPRSLVSRIAGRKTPPSFAPGGRGLAFGTLRPGAGRSLWLADLESSEVRLLVERAGLYFGMSWFPDGRRFGFVAQEEEGLAFESVDIETGVVERHRLIESHISSILRLSPKGDLLVGHGAREGGLNVWLMELAGGPARPLTHDAEGIGWPVWSPDGTRLAVEMMRGGDTFVGLMPAAGGPVREIVSRPGQSWPHSFSPDGRSLAFAGQRDGIWNVYSVPVEGGPERRLTPYDSPAVYVRYPDWSPLGDRIAYEYAESTSTVWVTTLPDPADGL